MTEEMLERTRELQQKLQLVARTGLLLTETLDLQTIVQAATDAGRELCGAQFGAFFYNVVNEAGESYLLYTISGVEREKFSKFPMPRNTEVFAPTFGGQGIVRSGDITKDPRYGKNAPQKGMPEGHLPIRSYLALPVKSPSGEVLGGLFYGHEKLDVFGEETEELVATVAAQAAFAIDNVRLREQLTRKVEDLNKAQQARFEAARHASELAAIVESSDDAILSKDLNGIITSWNAAATHIMGYKREEMIGQSILKLIPEDLHSEETTIIGKIRVGERVDHFETVRMRKNGERLAVSLSVSPVRDATGTVVGASKILRDISARKRMEETLIQGEKIAATGRMAATIAHEINNPLEAVVNLLYLAKEKAIDPEQIGYLTAAEGEVNRVSHLARQTLGFYREHSSAMLLSSAELMQDASRIYEPKCRASGIEIKRELTAKRRVVLRKGEMMQMISNLIANSIYAMPEGGTLTVAAEDVELPEEGVLLTIADTGIGIPAEQLPRIFEAFYTTRTAIGTGIGLFVTQQFVKGHGGTIEVESIVDAENHGTTMRIFLPLKNPYSATELSR